jgi:hypothetical protein
MMEVACSIAPIDDLSIEEREQRQAADIKAVEIYRAGISHLVTRSSSF